MVYITYIIITVWEHVKYIFFIYVETSCIFIRSVFQPSVSILYAFITSAKAMAFRSIAYQYLACNEEMYKHGLIYKKLKIDHAAV